MYERYIGYTSENSMLQIIYTYLINFLDVETLGILVAGDEACPDPHTTHPTSSYVESAKEFSEEFFEAFLEPGCNEVEEERLTGWTVFLGNTISYILEVTHDVFQWL